MPTKKIWQLQEAKARFSELIRAAAEEPQEITLRGKGVAMLLSHTEYAQITKPPKQTLYELLQSSPFRGVTLDLRRNKDATMRKIEL